MNGTIVTYKVKADKVEENESLVKAVYDELRSVNDSGIHYATFKKEDGVTFVHMAFFESEDKREILTNSKSFKAFQENIKERCEIPPGPEKIIEVDSFNFN